jgi:tetratricopeptide (TPR) repeat protein
MALPPAPEPAPSPHELGERALACLRAGELESFSALMRSADAVEDAHRRYRARRDLLHAGLEAAASVRAARLPELYLALAAAGVRMLDEEPREPVLANLTGVSLYELGALDAAEALFRAARRMDAMQPHVEGNLEEIARRRKAGVQLRLPRLVALALPELAARAERCAGRARPAEGLRMSLCMIVKDEEEMLPRCLEAVRPAVDEIVVVDTGSTDRTVEIARSFGARVLSHEWSGDFAQARNVALDAATGDWLLVLDPDEVLVPEDADALRTLSGRVWREAFYLVETHFTGELEDGTAVRHNALRLFRNRPEYRYEGRIHEQFAHRLPAIAERVEATGVRLEHYGYLGAVRDAREKSRRNIELLERQAAEDRLEGGQTPFHHFNLGSEFGAAGEAGRALEEFETAWELLQADPNPRSYGFVPSLVDRLVTALRITGDRARADEIAEHGLRMFPGFTDLVLEQAFAARDAGDTEHAVGLMERCLQMGDAPSAYSPTVGCGSYLALVALADLRRARCELEEAERLLVRCLEEHPRYPGVVLPLAGVMLARGAAPGAVVAAVDDRLADLTPTAHFMLGTALYEAGHAEHAEAQFRAVLQRQPENPQASIALAEALLTQRRWGEAVADAALRRAAGSELAAAELELFAAWAGAAFDSRTPEALPLEALPLLAVTLEALLRVVEIDAFAALVPLVDRLPLAWRQRRELLAAMYLRRGFLESAADEWIEVCQARGPDAQALLGLAQVAVARDLRDDALLLAQEATALEPDHPDAVRLLANLQAA